MRKVIALALLLAAVNLNYSIQNHQYNQTIEAYNPSNLFRGCTVSAGIDQGQEVISDRNTTQWEI